jgi:site-specific recombinase XerD
MKTLCEEIKLFLDNSSYKQKTKNDYKYVLGTFLRTLSSLTETKEEDVHLLKMSQVSYINGATINLPIDAPLLDEYFHYHNNNSAAWHLDMRKKLNRFFTYLNREYGFENVLHKTEVFNTKLKAESRPQRILSNHELIKLFNSILINSQNVIEDLMVFTVFATTGCRISEFINIRVKDIDVEQNTIMLFDTKYDKSRLLILRPGLAKTMEKYCKDNALNNNDKLYSKSKDFIRSRLCYFLEKANLPKVTVHSLRHSFSTSLFENHTNLTVIQQLLGHGDINITKAYVHSYGLQNEEITIAENEKVYYTTKKLIAGLQKTKQSDLFG